MDNTREMPRYKCHKEVWALQIKLIGVNEADGSGLITPEEAGYAAFKVSKEYMDKHKPQPGGYYVVYKGGYKSFSPAEALEDGYSKMSNVRVGIEITDIHADSLSEMVRYFKKMVQASDIPATEIRSDRLTTEYCNELIEALNA